jgi:hypothetical protein
VSPSPPPTLASPPTEGHVATEGEEQGVDEENLYVDHDDTPLRLHAIDKLIGNVVPPGLSRRVLNACDIPPLSKGGQS